MEKDWKTILTKEEFFSIKNIEEKISNKKDLFNRGHNYRKINFDDSFPKFILDNLIKYKEWII